MENIAPALLEWFYRNQRILPFRTDPSPYHVWLSEIMLQQTRVSAALPGGGLWYEKKITSPSLLRNATSPIEERPWHSGKLVLFARGSPR